MANSKTASESTKRSSSPDSLSWAEAWRKIQQDKLRWLNEKADQLALSQAKVLCGLDVRAGNGQETDWKTFTTRKSVESR